MRVMMQITPSHEAFNAAVRDGSAGPKMKRILDQQRPEAAYFAAVRGKRCAFLVVDVAEASQIPKYAEPWFLTFDADIELYPAMNAEDLKNSGLDEIARMVAEDRVLQPVDAGDSASRR